jgi:hypothetical protein
MQDAIGNYNTPYLYLIPNILGKIIMNGPSDPDIPPLHATRDGRYMRTFRAIQYGTQPNMVRLAI